MKRFFILWIMALIVVSFAGCKGKSAEEKAEQQAFDDAMKAVDDLMSTFSDASADIVGNDENQIESFVQESESIVKQNVSREYDGTYYLIDNDKEYVVIKDGEVTKGPDIYDAKQFIIEDGKLKCLKSNGTLERSYSFVCDSLIKDIDENKEDTYGTNYYSYEYVKKGSKPFWAYELEKDVNLNLSVRNNDETYHIYDSGKKLLYVSSIDNNLYNSASSGIELINTDVRCVPFYETDWSRIKTLFYINNHDELWAYGSNKDGLLGDGTGVDRSEHIKILDDVSAVYNKWNRIYAIKNDKTLWTWGNGIYAPEKIADDIIAFITNGMYINEHGQLMITGSGYFRGIKISDEPTAILNNVKEVNLRERGGYVVFYDGSVKWYAALGRNYTNYENSVTYKETIVFDGSDNKVETLYVEDISATKYNYIFVIFENGECWASGNNDEGQLGDGTKIKRDDFVKIMDNVVMVGRYKLLLGDGTLMTWDSKDPTPKAVAENVVWFDIENDQFITNNKELWHNGKILLDCLKIPGDDPIDVAITPIKEIVTVSVKLPKNWEEPYLWAAGPKGNAFPDWPGEPIANKNEDDWFTIEMPGWVTKLVISCVDNRDLLLGFKAADRIDDFMISIYPYRDIFLEITDLEDWEISYSE